MDYWKIIKPAMAELRSFERSFVAQGFECCTDISSCQWRLQQEILNKLPNQSMEDVADNYVENIKQRCWNYVGVEG